ncbi:hypothetical protein OIV52_31345, partial [Burkholderia pseudomallei]|nr:hypothetical protein [Burkholderia pseudomallei]
MAGSDATGSSTDALPASMDHRGPVGAGVMADVYVDAALVSVAGVDAAGGATTDAVALDVFDEISPATSTGATGGAATGATMFASTIAAAGLATGVTSPSGGVAIRSVPANALAAGASVASVAAGISGRQNAHSDTAKLDGVFCNTASRWSGAYVCWIHHSRCATPRGAFITPGGSPLEPDVE